MKTKNWIAALAACVLLPATAQSLNYTPTTAEAKQARENTRRDAKLADAMEKARLKEEARPVAVYVPKEEARKDPAKATKPEKLETFSAVVPGSKKAKPKKKG